MMPVEQKMKRLLMFNLATDAENSALGFAISWIAELAKHVAAIDVITMYAGKYDLPEHVRVYSVGKEKNNSEPRRFIEFYRIFSGSGLSMADELIPFDSAQGDVSW